MKTSPHAGFNPIQDVRDFHRKFDLHYEGKPRALPEEMRQFRSNFLHEESEEYADDAEALSLLIAGLMTISSPKAKREAIAQYLAGQLDALLDLMYVLLGNAEIQGFLENGIFEEGWKRVHAANMAKVRAERPEDSKRGSSFDVVKPEGWVAPDHTDLVEAHIHD